MFFFWDTVYNILRYADYQRVMAARMNVSTAPLQY